MYETHTPLKLKPLCYICVITNITLQVHNKVYEIREENLSIWFRKLNKRPSLISAPLLISAPQRPQKFIKRPGRLIEDLRYIDLTGYFISTQSAANVLRAIVSVKSQLSPPLSAHTHAHLCSRCGFTFQH